MTVKETLRRVSVKDLLKSMKMLKCVYPSRSIKGYIVRSKSGTTMSNVIKLNDLTNKFNYLHNEDYRKTYPIYSGQDFEVIEVIREDNSIEATYASSDDENFILRKDGRFKQLTDSHKSIVLVKLTL